MAALAAEEASSAALLALRNASEAIRDEEKADREWDERAQIKEAECKQQAKFECAARKPRVKANSEKEKHKNDQNSKVHVRNKRQITNKQHTQNPNIELLRLQKMMQRL